MADPRLSYTPQQARYQAQREAYLRQEAWMRQQAAQAETMASRPKPQDGVVDAEWTEVEPVPLLGPPEEP